MDLYERSHGPRQGLSDDAAWLDATPETKAPMRYKSTDEPDRYQHWQTVQWELQEKQSQPHRPRHARPEESEEAPEESASTRETPMIPQEWPAGDGPRARTSEIPSVRPNRPLVTRGSTPKIISPMRRTTRYVGGSILLLLGLVIGALPFGIMPVALRYNHGLGVGPDHALPLLGQLSVLGGCVLLFLLGIAFCASAVSVWRENL